MLFLSALLSAFFFVVLTCSVLFYPILRCPVLSCPVLSCPALPCPALSCTVLCCPVLSYPVVLSSHLFSSLNSTVNIKLETISSNIIVTKILLDIFLPAVWGMFFLCVVLKCTTDLSTFKLFFLSHQLLLNITLIYFIIMLPRSYIREPMDLGTITTETKMCFYGTDHALFAKVSDSIFVFIFILLLFSRFPCIFLDLLFVLLFQIALKKWNNIL